METNVCEVLDEGMRIVLTDGSVWEPVDFCDRMKAFLWCPATRVWLSELADGECLLENIDTGDEGIAVRQVCDDSCHVT